MKTPVNVLVRDVVLKKLLNIIMYYEQDSKIFLPTCELLMKYFPDVIVETV